MKIVEVDINKIKIGGGKREPVTAKVHELADSIEQIGLINPISITKNNWLITGQHRYLAFKSLNRTTIPAIIVDEEDDNILKLQEIDENLIRKELTTVQRSNYLLERKEIYERMYPETIVVIGKKLAQKRWNKNDDATETVSFASDTSSKTGLSERAIQQDIQIAKNIDKDNLELIEEKQLPKKEMLKIARLPKEEQREYIESYEKPVRQIKIEPSHETQEDIEDEIDQNDEEIVVGEDDSMTIEVYCKGRDQLNYVCKKLDELGLDYSWFLDKEEDE